ncbi:MAG: hypothetical protein DRN05_07420, partial [Thermoplasmata archaeon]
LIINSRSFILADFPGFIHPIQKENRIQLYQFVQKLKSFTILPQIIYNKENINLLTSVNIGGR